MKYGYKKWRFFFFAVVCTLVVLLSYLRLIMYEVFDEIDFPPTVWLLMLLFFIPALYFLWSGLEVHTYAMMKEDGIHLISRKAGELGLLPWKLFVDCAHGPCGPDRTDVVYMVLLTQWDAVLHSKSANCYRGKLTKQDLQAYRLDEAIEEIAQGELTVEELKTRPMILLAAEKKQYEAWRSLWREAAGR